MMQVIESIAALGGQINELHNYVTAATFRREELELMRGELRDIKQEIRGGHAAARHASDYSQSPAVRSHFASPRQMLGNADPAKAEHQQRHYDLQTAHGADSPATSNASDHSGGKGPHTQPGARSNPHQKLNSSSIDDESIRRFDPLAGQLSIPIEHTTGAHKLLIAWDAIHPFYEGIITQDQVKNYVWHEETRRGQLRLFGQGEGNDGMPSSDSLRASVRSPPYTDADPAASPASNPAMAADGFWGFGFDAPMEAPFDTAGGLTPSGSLCLDRATVTRLFKSFMENMWVLHPFFHQRHITQLLERFIRRFCWDANSRGSFDSSASPAGPGSRPMKRKRSEGGDEDARNPETRRMPLERSVQNAVILLILALGKNCEHKAPLPAPVMPGEDGMPGAGPSPPPDGSGPGWRGGIRQPNGTGHSSPYEKAHAQSPRLNRKMRNIDRIPGLAYYAYAVGILGEQQGAPELAHVHAKILAGLFMAQMARVIDSWSWIHAACTACKLLFRDEQSVQSLCSLIVKTC